MNEDFLLNIKCDYTFEEVTKATTVAPNKALTLFRIFGIILLGMTVLLFISNLLIGSDEYFEIIILFFLGLFLLLISLPKIRLLLFLKLSRKQNNVCKDGISNEYTFTNNCFYVISTTSNSTSNTKVDYKDITHFAYNNTDVYLFINTVTCYLCKKECFKDDELKQLEMLIKSQKSK